MRIQRRGDVGVKGRFGMTASQFELVNFKFLSRTKLEAIIYYFLQCNLGSKFIDL